jgi:hypothetical protein
MGDRSVGRAPGRVRPWVAGLVMLAVLAGCSSSPSVPTVTVVGDATTVVARAVLAGTLHPPYSPVFVVRPAGRIAGLSALLRASMAATGTPTVVLADVGTTDALHPTTAPTSGPLLAPLVQATASVSCVVLTTVNVRADQQSGGTVAARLNREITSLALSDPKRYKVVDWNEFLATLPAPSVPTYLRPDGITETAAGAHWLATADLDGVHACGTRHQPTVIGPNRA